MRRSVTNAGEGKRDIRPQRCIGRLFDVAVDSTASGSDVTHPGAVEGQVLGVVAFDQPFDDRFPGYPVVEGALQRLSVTLYAHDLE